MSTPAGRRPSGRPRPAGGRRTGRALAPAAMLLAAALPFGACSGGADGASAARAQPQAGDPARAPRAARVTTAPVKRRDVNYAIETSGSIEAEEEVQVVAGVEGVVTRVNFSEGDRVTPATVLAEIDPARFRLRAERARASHEKSEAQRRLALSDLRRREELAGHTPPLISEEDLERARQEVDALAAAAAEARAEQELAAQDRERSIVRPLVSGVINRKSITTGQHVEAKAVLATLVDAGRLRLRFRVSEQESVQLRPGMTVTFTTSAWPGRSFGAHLFHVSSSADPASRMVECLARIDGPGADLRPGFFAEVRADVASRRDAIVIPERSVRATQNGFVVFVVEENRARERRVTLGLRTGDGSVEIIAGLDETAPVITDGGDALRDGAAVEIDAPGS